MQTGHGTFYANRSRVTPWFQQETNISFSLPPWSWLWRAFTDWQRSARKSKLYKAIGFKSPGSNDHPLAPLKNGGMQLVTGMQISFCKVLFPKSSLPRDADCSPVWVRAVTGITIRILAQFRHQNCSSSLVAGPVVNSGSRANRGCIDQTTTFRQRSE